MSFPVGTTCAMCGGFLRFSAGAYQSCRACKRGPRLEKSPLEEILDQMDLD